LFAEGIVPVQFQKILYVPAGTEPLQLVKVQNFAEDSTSLSFSQLMNSQFVAVPTDWVEFRKEQEVAAPIRL
jgi:hypothetical protein